MKKKDLITLYTMLNQLSNIKSTKFAYFIMKNLKLLKSEIEIIRELNKIPPNYLEYERKRIAICEKSSDKDEEGKPIAIDGSFQIKNRKGFDKKIAELNDEYKEAREEKANKDVEIAEFLMGEDETQFHKIKLEDLPELSAKQMMVLEELIID